MSALLLALSLSSLPPVGLWERDTAQAPRSAVDSVLVVLRDALSEAELPAEAGVSRCGSIPKCLATRAHESGGIAVGLSIAQGRKGLLVDLEATAPDGEVLDSTTFALPATGERALPEVRTFVSTLAARWKARAPVAAPTPEASEPVTHEVAESLPESFWARPPARVGLISTGVTVLGTIALGIAGAVVKTRLDTSLAANPPVLTRPQALEQAGLANGLLTGALISAIISGVVGGVLLIFFGLDDS